MADARSKIDLRSEASGACRVSDDELLRAVWRDLGAVYTDVLRTPIPARLAVVRERLEASLQARSPSLRLER